MKKGIPCFLNEDLFNKGLRIYERWYPDIAPHIAISGNTGSGKTYAIKLLLAKVSKYVPSSRLTVCDFKGDSDFEFLKGTPQNFYRFDACVDGFNHFYEEFVEVQRRPETHPGMHILLYDEWAATMNFLEKKEAEVLKQRLASLLMLGRSFGYHVILAQQRLDAEYFGKSRDNFNIIITLSNPSKEVVNMFYSDFRDEIRPDRKRGTGYMLINGSNLKRIIVPEIGNMDSVHNAIKRIVEL